MLNVYRRHRPYMDPMGTMDIYIYTYTSKVTSSTGEVEESLLQSASP